MPKLALLKMIQEQLARLETKLEKATGDIDELQDMRAEMRFLRGSFAWVKGLLATAIGVTVAAAVAIILSVPK